MMGPLRAAWRRLARSTGVGIGIMLLGVCALLQTITDIRSDAQQDQLVRDLSTQLACRYDLGVPLSEIQAAKNDALGSGLIRLFVYDDELGAQAEAERYAALSADEDEALAARADAVETCEAAQRSRG